MSAKTPAIERLLRHVLLSPAYTRQIVGGLSESTIRRMVEAGTFPKPIVLSRNGKGVPVRVAWVLGEVLDWCRERIAADRGLER